jgi:hypothetical protein
MIMATQRSDQLARAILETADGMRRTGVMSEEAHAMITLRHIGVVRRAIELTDRAASEFESQG